MPDKYPHKLLVSDIDGTLVDNNQELISANKRAVRELKQQGLFFTLASGRKFKSAERFVRDLGIEIPLIFYNGAQLLNPEGKVVSEKRLDFSQTRAALLVNEGYQLDALVYYRDGIYVEQVNGVVEKYQLKDGVECTAVGNLALFIREDVTKVLFIGEQEKLLSFARDLRKIFSTANLVNSEPEYLELLPAGVSKGEALVELAGYLQISLDDIIAIGDNLNDLEMIEKAGLGVATANAHPDIIRAADYVTERNNEEGSVAEVIEEIMLARSC